MTTTFGSKTWTGTLKVTSPFGAIDSIRTKPHAGVDITTSGACLAPFDGVVSRSLSQGVSTGGYGNYFQLVSHDGRFVFMVGHNNTNSDKGLRVGDTVKKGQAILASYGIPSTGNTTGPHYHEQLTDHGKLVDLFDYLGKTFDPAPTVSPPVVTGWDGVSTLYKGSYTNNGVVRTVRVGETIYAAAKAEGITLDQARAWTKALAKSKYAARTLPAKAWYWDGTDTYYAGATFATINVVAKYAAEDVKVAEAKEAAARQALEAAAEATDAAEALDKAPEVDALVLANHATEEAEAEVVEANTAMADAIIEAARLIPVVEANIAELMTSTETADTTQPLAGLLAERPATRKRVYYSYAALALLVSFAPDIVVADVLTDAVTPDFIAYSALGSSILLKIGTALGFVAASNTAKK